MSTRITGQGDDVCALYDSTTGIAFGEVFQHETAAEDFLLWLAWGAEQENTYFVGDSARAIRSDPVHYTPIGLIGVRVAWQKDMDAWEAELDRAVTSPASELGFIGWIKAGRP
jgi:hypothetical protein